MIEANLPWVESPFFYDILKTKELSDAQIKIATEFHEQGYAVISNVLPVELIDKVQHETEHIGFNTTIPLKIPRDTHRVQDLWLEAEAVRNLACYPTLLETLEMLYDRKPVPFQTLNFKFGTQQRAHSDAIHFSSLPARFMCGVWVALEDITPENGALFYYPKSHKLQEYNFSHFRSDIRNPSYENYPEYEDFIAQIMTRYGFEKQHFYAKKGDVLIWSSNITHGGSKVTDENSTRWSQVTHYFFQDCIYYTPMLSNMVTNELYMRNNLTDITTGKIIQQSYNGHHIKKIRLKGSRSILNNNIKIAPKLLRFVGKIL